MDNYGYQPDENGKVFAITRYPHVINNREVRNDYFVEVNSRSKVLKNPKFYKRLSALCVFLVIFFLCLLITVAFFYMKEKSRTPICTSDECLRSAANLKYSINFDADPCENFYEYTCGHWSKEHPNHGWFPSFSTFATIDERIAISAMKFLKSKSNISEPSPVKQSRDFYESCMDVESINNAGLSVLYKYIEIAELPKIPSIFTKSEKELIDFKFDWLRADAVIRKIFDMDILIGFTVAENIYNRSENVMYIGVPGQFSPLPSPLKKSKKKLKYKKNEIDDTDDIDYDDLRREANEKIMKFVIETIIKNITKKNPDPDILQQAVNILLNMTFYIDDLVTNHTSYGNDDYTFHQYPIKNLQSEINNLLLNNINKQYDLIIEKYLDHLFENTNITIDISQDLLYIADIEINYLPKVIGYILTTSDVYLELYMWWITVFAMIFNTTSDIVDYISKQTAPFYSDFSLRSRSLDCAYLVSNFMGMAVSYGIADKTFTNNTKPKVEEMLYNIKNAFVQRVNSLTWMDQATKQATLEKSKEMISFIGYPEWLFEKDALEYYYEGIIIKPDTYLENMMSLVKDYIPNNLAELRTINKRTWRTDPITVNAFNSFTDNAINVPMAILSYPIYNLGLEVLNYGAMGSVLGHELTHGFDNSGRKHDKFGNYKQWWTNETIETFESKTECFVKQYDNFTYDGIEQHIQGRKTLGENLADNGGLHHAFQAYQNFIQQFGHEPRLPGFENFSNNQLFFIAYGSIWCETVSLKDIENQIQYDEHCPNMIRVLGSLQNSKDFAQAFNCPIGSKMNPSENKCRIW